VVRGSWFALAPLSLGSLAQLLLDPRMFPRGKRGRLAFRSTAGHGDAHGSFIGNPDHVATSARVAGED
jgi:hypothetical protein